MTEFKGVTYFPRHGPIMYAVLKLEKNYNVTVGKLNLRPFAKR